MIQMAPRSIGRSFLAGTVLVVLLMSAPDISADEARSESIEYAIGNPDGGGGQACTFPVVRYEDPGLLIPPGRTCTWGADFTLLGTEANVSIAIVDGTGATVPAAYRFAWGPFDEPAYSVQWAFCGATEAAVPEPAETLDVFLFTSLRAQERCGDDGGPATRGTLTVTHS